MPPYQPESKTLGKLINKNRSSSEEEVDTYQEGDYVIVNYEGQYFPGKITSKDSNTYLITTMAMGNKFWK